jgi:hypothetical protein
MFDSKMLWENEERNKKDIKVKYGGKREIEIKKEN